LVLLDFALTNWPSDDGVLFLSGHQFAYFRELDTEMLWWGRSWPSSPIHSAGLVN
jgi:hypothetical protein